jgi:hypothetical protein
MELKNSTQNNLILSMTEPTKCESNSDWNSYLQSSGLSPDDVSNSPNLSILHPPNYCGSGCALPDFMMGECFPYYVNFPSREDSSLPLEGPSPSSKYSFSNENSSLPLEGPSPSFKYSSLSFEDNQSFPDELEDRCIEILNFNIVRTNESIVRHFCDIPNLDRIDMSKSKNGLITVHYFNLKSALWMRQQQICVDERQWILRFRVPPKIFERNHPPNNGMIVLFCVPQSITNQSLHEKFQQFGEIREVRMDKSKSHGRFIEFWDLRVCEKAYKAVRSGKVFKGNVKVEFARPGGYRKYPEKYWGNRCPIIVRCQKANQ